MFALRGVYATRLRVIRPSLSSFSDNCLLYLYVSLYGCVILLPLMLFFEGDKLYSLISYSSSPIPDDDDQTLTFLSLPLLFLINSSTYCIYNEMSFYVLGKVPFLTHSILNVVRRLVVISCSSLLLSSPLSLLNICGVGLVLTLRWIITDFNWYFDRPLLGRVGSSPQRNPRRR